MIMNKRVDNLRCVRDRTRYMRGQYEQKSGQPEMCAC